MVQIEPVGLALEKRPKKPSALLTLRAPLYEALLELTRILDSSDIADMQPTPGAVIRSRHAWSRRTAGLISRSSL
jgi:hypothetical protein